MRTYNAPEGHYDNEGQNKGIGLTAAPLAKVFIYFALGLLVTGIVSLGYPYLLSYMASSNESVASNVYLWSMIISLIAYFPLAIAIQWKAMWPRTSLMAVLYFTYSVVLGILVSSVVAYAIETTESLWPITMAFFITGGLMLLMGLLGLVFKNIGVLIPFITVAMLGVLTLSLLAIFTGSSTLYWIIDFVFFGLILISTAIDINTIKRMADGGWMGSETNFAIFGAYMLLTDFVMIFIRVLFYIILASNRR